jgi:hypothetical protein
MDDRPTAHTRLGAMRLLLVAVLALSGSACLEGIDGGDGGASCQPHFADGQACEAACNASSVVLIQGNAYCTQTCGAFNECPGGHVCVRFAPGDVPESACLPPCRDGDDCPNGFLGLCSPEGVCGL